MGSRLCHTFGLLVDIVIVTRESSLTIPGVCALVESPGPGIKVVLIKMRTHPGHSHRSKIGQLMEPGDSFCAGHGHNLEDRQPALRSRLLRCGGSDHFPERSAT